LLQGPSLGKLVKRFGEARLTTTGFAAYAAGYAMLAFTRTVPMLAASTTVAAVGTLVRPTLTSSITQAASRREQGVVLGLTQSLTSIAQIVAPPLAGLMIQHGLLTTWGISAAAVAAVGLLWSRRTG
jgi:MFS family permease